MAKKFVAEYDVTKHILVPKQTKLNEKEKAALLEQHKITTEHLPHIHVSDPSIAHLEPEEGDVIKIVRESPTTGTTEYYRVVVHV